MSRHKLNTFGDKAMSHGKENPKRRCPKCGATETRKRVRHTRDCPIGKAQRESDKAVRAAMESGRDW